MSLYRKHRPQTWNALVGQDVIKNTLSNQVMTGGIAHAYLFSGPRGTGKTTTARLLAKAINCTARTEGSSEPCNTCALCTDISRGMCMDVLEIDAASHTGVDNVRENIIETTQFRPNFARYKVFIIDEVHMLSNAAFNALLKTLEEPPSHVIFVLATTEPHKLPATILSRCERYQFKRIGADVMRARLVALAEAENVNIEDAVMERVIQLSEGCMRDAESLLGQCMATGEKEITSAVVEHILPSTYDHSIVEFLQLVLRGEGPALLALLDRLYTEGVNWPHFMNALLEEFKNALLFKVAGSRAGLLMNNKELAGMVGGLNLKRLIALTDSLIERKGQMTLSPIPQLPLELWVAEHVLEAGGINEDDNGHDNKAGGTGDDNTKNNSEATNTEPSKQVKETHAETGSQASAATSEIPDSPQPIATAPQQTKDLDSVYATWQNCVDHICLEFPSLAFILKAVTLEEWNGERLTLAFDYALHKDKILEHRIKSRIEHIVQERGGIKVLLEGRVRETRRPVEERPDPALEKLSAALGGQVV